MMAERGARMDFVRCAWFAGNARRCLPAPSLEAHPRALAHRAEVARFAVNTKLRTRCFACGDAAATARTTRKARPRRLHSLATIARRQGDFSWLLLISIVRLNSPEPSSAVSTKCGNTRGLCLVALGQWISAEREFRSAAVAEERHDEHYAG